MEQKKVLWTIISVIVFLIIVVAAGLVFFSPKKQAAAPRSLTVNGAPVQTPVDPEGWVRQPETVPGFETPEQSAGGTAAAPGKGTPQAAPDATAGAAGTAGSGTSTSVTYGQQPESSTDGSVKTTGDALTLTITPAEKKAPAAATGKPAAPAPHRTVPATKPATARTAAKTTAIPVEKPATAAAKSVATAKPAARPAVNTSVLKPAAARAPTGYWIQAGSFTSKTKAERAKSLLAEKGLSPRITTTVKAGTDYYRVRVGPYTTEAEASSWLEKVKAVDGLEQSIVLQSAK